MGSTTIWSEIYRVMIELPQASIRVVLDANVLDPAALRDTLLRAAEAELFSVFWSNAILDEMARALMTAGKLSRDQVHRSRTKMNAAFPEALVTGYEHLLPAMANDPADRHVVAVAVHSGAQLILTQNLRDFSLLPPGVEAQSPDHFLCRLLAHHSHALSGILEAQSAALTSPPIPVDRLLEGLATLVPKYAALLAEFRAA